MKLPGIGTIVWFHDGHSETAEPQAAIVTGVYEATVNLRVFTASGGVMGIFHVPFVAGGARLGPGQWCELPR